MKTGTHNLGSNAFSNLTLVRAQEGALVIRQITRGCEQSVHLSAEQIDLLKDVL